jgi:putative PIN family toxin of toxin-antitoxin system
VRVLIDTNVLVSAALRDRVPEEIILFVAAHPDFEWIVSPEILEEYKTVLRRDKFSLPEELLHGWFDIIEELTTTIEVKGTLKFPRDQKDAKFLVCALAADAKFFVTGDKDFSQAQKMVNTTILSVSLFKKTVCDAWS